MNILAELENDYRIISPTLHNITDSELKAIITQLDEQFKVKNGDIALVRNGIKQMLIWFNYHSGYKRKHQFAYDILSRMNEKVAPSLVTSEDVLHIGRKKIFISHSSNDKKYCDALLQLLRRIGIPEENIVYTSNTKCGVPLGENIFAFLKRQFDEELYVLFIFSDSYFESAPTLNEMGAAWVTSSSFSALAVPGFDYSNKKFQNCAIDSQSIVGNLVDINIITQLKNNLVKFFSLKVAEDTWISILEEYANSIK